MAKKKLTSIKWPNLPNDTYILDAGKVEFDKDETYSANTVGEVLQQKANIDGSYSDLTAGSAEQLISTVRTNDKTPYLFRTSGGSVDIGDREFVNAIVGGTVAFNQLLHRDNFAASKTQNDITFTNNGDGTVSLSGTATARCDYAVGERDVSASHVFYMEDNTNVNGVYIGNSSWGVNSKMWKENYGGHIGFNIMVKSGTAISGTVKCIPQVFDLTQMFGSTIADYIYSLETATTGAGVAFFKKLGFNKPYYAYNAGELMSVSGLSSHDMTGFNQWDEEWELGTFDSDGTAVSINDRIRSKNYIPCIAGATYFYKSSHWGYFFFYDADKNAVSTQTNKAPNSTITAPSNASYMRFRLAPEYGTTYNHDICINISWDGSRNGEYEPYVKHSYPLDSTLTLRGIPKLDASNNLYYDGDAYEADGTVNRKYGIVDLGTLTWNKTTYSRMESSGFSGIKIPANTSTKASIICPKYITDTAYNITSNTNPNSIGISSGGNVVIYDTNYDSYTSATFKTAMSGVYLVYELATPTTETADPYTTPQIVNDFGTEEFVTTSIVPVGHDTDYPINLVAKLEMAPNSPDGDGTYVVKQTNGMNEYVPLIIPSGIPAVPTTDGTYKLTVTVSNGTPTLSWEA